MNRNDKQKLEDRVIDFTNLTIDIVESLTEGKVSNYYGNQLLRSGGSPSLTYGEAQDPESRIDFI
ncbi:MAG: hypothetical protein ACHQFW_06030, partial [Chitinophagales bacterium]